ncbi:MAG TPA: cache domain-containing protein [Candidatus Paceibacterota bacterium]|nr:cache domain-containing protein [Candidatus Paceibacterota bacterium]
MSTILIIQNLGLALGLLGAIVFFLIGWLFAEAFALKRDMFSFARALGFFLLAAWRIVEALYASNGLLVIVSNALLFGGLALVFLAYLIEPLPSRPKIEREAFAIAPLAFAAGPNIGLAGGALLIVAILLWRYFRYVERQVKWLIVGFCLLALEGILPAGLGPQNWLVLSIVNALVLLAFALWIRSFISLRLREEALVIFIAGALGVALLVTTAFSSFLLYQREQETRHAVANAQVMFHFYLDSLRQQVLAAAQTAATNSDAHDAIKNRDGAAFERASADVLPATGASFWGVTTADGAWLYRTQFPVQSGESILNDAVGPEALQGFLSSGVDRTPTEGFLIRGAAPVYDQGKIIGAVIVGASFDRDFALRFQDVSGFQTTFVANGQVAGSSLLNVGTAVTAPAGAEVTALGGADALGVSQAIKDAHGAEVGEVIISTTPQDVYQSSQTTNRVTILIVFIIVVGMIIPLYRFTKFLTS